MVREVKLRQVGGSVGATLPKDMAERLHLSVGDRVLAIETEQGVLLSPYDPTVDLTAFETEINYLTFPVVNKPATSTWTIVWRLTT